MAGRALGNAAIMFHTALAAHQGLTASEEKTLDLLFTDFVHELEDLFATFSTGELETILRFMQEAARRQQAATRRLTDGKSHPDR